MKDVYWKLFHETGEPIYYMLSKAHEEKAAAAASVKTENKTATMSAGQPTAL